MDEINTLIDVLNENSMQFTEREIRDMMDAELEKEPGEMDTDLIVLCLDVLDGKYATADNTVKEIEDKKKSKKRIKLRKALLVAAIFAVILVIAIPVGAKYVHINASDDVVKYDKDHFSVNLKSDENLQDVVDDSILPKALINDNCSIFDMETSDIDIILHFKDNVLNIYGNIIINNNTGTEFLSGQFDMNEEFYSAEEININGIKALVIQSNDLNTIMYLADDKEYTITLHNSDFETAKEIANTIGEK